MGQRPLHRVLQQTLALAADEERHFGPFSYFQGSNIVAQCFGSARHYFGVFNAVEYNRRRATAARQQGRFPFLFGSDRTAHRLTYTATHPGQLYLVVRVGVFNPGGGMVTVVLDIG